MSKFICEFCKKEFTMNTNLRRHIRLHHQEPSSSFKCVTCKLYFSNREEWEQHSHTISDSGAINIYCDKCRTYISNTKWHNHIRTNMHKTNSAEKTEKYNNYDGSLKCIKSVFNNRIITYLIENSNETDLIPENFLYTIRGNVIELLYNVTQEYSSVKFNIELFCEYMLVKEDHDTCTIEVKSHQTKMVILSISTTSDDIIDLYNEQCNNIIKKMSEFQERDSGWSLIKISHLEININKYKCIKGSHYIPLPSTIKKKHACINVQNDDEYCFKWAVISALYPVELNSYRCSTYKVTNINEEIITLENNIILNFKSLHFPLPLNKIKVFESNNPHISINVFGLGDDNNIVGPYYFTKQEKSQHINLLLLEEGEGRFHYVWIKNISRYVPFSIYYDQYKEK